MHKDKTGEIVPAIVSEELWDKANEILEKQSKDVKNRQGICNHNNLFTGKSYCIHCRASYHRKDVKERVEKSKQSMYCFCKFFEIFPNIHTDIMRSLG